MNAVEAINNGWAWTDVNAEKVHAISPIGHVLFSDDEGCFYYLDTDGMTLRSLGSKEAAETYMKSTEVREIWLAENLVRPALERMGEPPPGHTFTISPSAWVEGKFSPDQMCILPLEEILFLSGDLARQIKDLPDGAEIQLKIVD